MTGDRGVKGLLNPRGRWARKDYTPEEIAYLQFIGNKIKRRRKQLKLSQSKVGMMIMTTFQQVQKYEKGKNVINNIKLERIRKALCIPEHRMGFLTNKYNRRYKPVWKINEKTSI